jgi:hypothetical protein
LEPEGGFSAVGPIYGIDLRRMEKTNLEIIAGQREACLMMLLVLDAGDDLLCD